MINGKIPPLITPFFFSFLFGVEHNLRPSENGTHTVNHLRIKGCANVSAAFKSYFLPLSHFLIDISRLLLLAKAKGNDDNGLLLNGHVCLCVCVCIGCSRGNHSI